MVSIGTSVFFAEISGSAVADVAALGTILIPAMKSRGYSKEFAAAAMSSAASLAIIIPPSIPMILYAVMAQTSTVKLFVAGIVPGLIGAVGLACRLLAGRALQFPDRGALPARASLADVQAKRCGRFMLPVAILGSIFGGIVTATEGAGMAVLAALRRRRLDLSRSRLGAVEGLHRWRHPDRGGHAVRRSLGADRHVPHRSAGAADARPCASPHHHEQVLVLLLLNVVFLILGMFLHSAAAIILVIPIVMPLVNAVGIDPIHFGLVVTLNLGIGQQTPPVASVLMTACAIAKSDIWAMTAVNIPYILALLRC